MTVLRELITLLGYDVDEAGVVKAEKIFDGLKSAANAVVTAVAAGTAAVTAIVAETVVATRETTRWASALQVTNQEIEELGFAAERVGAETEDVGDFLKELAVKAGDARDGSGDLQKAFQKLGVRITDARGKIRPVTDLFNEVADGIAKTQDASERIFLADILGSDAGTKLLPLLARGSAGIQSLRDEAVQLGFVLDKDAVEATRRMSVNWQVLLKILLSVRRRIATGIIPVLNEVIERFIAWFKANRDLVDGGLARLVEFLVSAVRAVETFVEMLLKLRRTIIDNQRSIAVFAGILLTLLVPSLFAVAKAYGAVTLAAIRTAVAAAAPFVGLLVLAGLVALFIEDVFVLVSGGESAIGNLFEAFTKSAQDPQAHWLVVGLASIIGLIRDAIFEIDAFFKIVFGQALAGEGVVDGFVRTLKMAGEGVVLFFENVGRSIYESISNALRDALEAVPIPDRLLELAGPGSFFGDVVTGVTDALAGGGPLSSVSPSNAPALPPGGGTAVTATFASPNISITVDGSSADPTAIADETARRVSEETERSQRQAFRELTGGVVR